MALIDEVKVALRVTSGSMDEEIRILLDSALSELRYAGVPAGKLEEGSMDPRAKAAVLLFCKARFGYDNDDAERLEALWRAEVVDLINRPSMFPGEDSGEGGE